MAVLSGSLSLAPDSAAAMGLFVGRPGATLRGGAATVVVLRDGTRTVVTMQSEYAGPPEDFALVVPVPQALRRGDVRTLPADVLARVDAATRPRLTAVWEQNPCEQAEAQARGDWFPVRNASSLWFDTWPPVPIEARPTASEYDFEMLGARDSARVVEWLREHGYALPAGAEAALRSYAQAGLRFLVARVDRGRARRDATGGVKLSPLQFSYESETLALPVRLGLLDADGPRALTVHVLAHGQYGAVGRDNVAVPSSLELSPASQAVFDGVYAALLDHLFAARPGAVLTEYAHRREFGAPLDWGTMGSLGGDDLWAMWRAPPSSHAVQFDLAAEEPFLATDPAVRSKYARRQPRPRVWGPDEGPNGLTHTKLQLRLDPAAAGEDLVLAPVTENVQSQPSDGGTNFQAQFAIRHRWPGLIACAQPRREVWGSQRYQIVHVPVAAPAGREVVLAEHVVGGLAAVHEATRLLASPGGATGEPPPRTAGCGRCQADGGAGLGSLLALALARRRRPRR
ncbi:DUF2330 domain-containing protein [Nannocystis bainbridge]|uniref:DUF2330 domain-containing protein n=1 Tax=Nannocystis bainbridge TaxID=2995303 RepID=A0ABT5E2S6_9BACT|nr:DUF2330 domain-containing protein [Nannocystis bainbridge]MDC0720172.1 DUF2330 domain-containing protein [Nannocystis bainbridge]